MDMSESDKKLSGSEPTVPIFGLESVKLLADHMKSVWTLSAAGLALTFGFIGLIGKETPRFDSTLSIVVFSFIAFFVGASAFVFLLSIKLSFTSQRWLINHLIRAEFYRDDPLLQTNEGNEPETTKKNNKLSRLENVAFFISKLTTGRPNQVGNPSTMTSTIDANIRECYTQARMLFYRACFLLVASLPLLFLMMSTKSASSIDSNTAVNMSQNLKTNVTVNLSEENMNELKSACANLRIIAVESEQDPALRKIAKGAPKP